MRKIDFVNTCYADTDLSSLENLTVVIPTYNRNYYLSRCLWYHAHFPFGALIVADSSSTEKKVINRITVERISSEFDISIQYLEYDPETEKYGGDIYRKWYDALKHVNTGYSQIITDKEFLIPSTVNRCIQYLEQNTLVATAEGKYYYIESPKIGEYTTRNMYPSKVSLLQNDAMERLKVTENGKNRSSNLLGLRRADFHKNLYEALEENKIDDIRFGEFTTEFLTIIRSPVVYLETPYCYRDITKLASKNSLKKDDSSSLRYPTLELYISDGIYNDYFNRFVHTLAPEITDKSNCSVEEAEHYVRTKIPAILRMRGFYGNEKATEDPLWYIWRKSPAFIKHIAGAIVPKGYLEYSRVKTPEERGIIQILESTKEDYMSDTPII